jgi:hypothetical protein
MASQADKPASEAQRDSVVKFTILFVHSQDIGEFMQLSAKLFPKLFATPLFPPNTIFAIERLVFSIHRTLLPIRIPI